MPKLTAEQITDVSVKVYENLLNAPSGGGKGSADRMKLRLDDPAKFRRFASAYDHIVRATLEVIGMDEQSL